MANKEGGNDFKSRGPMAAAETQAEMLASAAAAAAQAKEKRRRAAGGRRIGSRLLRGRHNNSAAAGGGSRWNEVQIAERDARIESLEREVEASAATIKDVRSELVKLRTASKQEEYHAQKKVEFLKEENVAYALRVAELEEHLFRLGGMGGPGKNGKAKEAMKEHSKGEASPSHDGNSTISLDATYVAQLRSDVDKSKKSARQMERELARQIEESSSIEQKLRGKIASLTAELGKQKATASALSDQLETKKSDIEDLLAKLDCRESTVRSIYQKIVDRCEQTDSDESGLQAAYFEELELELRKDIEELRFKLGDADATEEENCETVSERLSMNLD